MSNRTCNVPGCEEPRKALGFCNAHAGRYYRTGDPQAHVPIKKLVRRPAECQVDGCDKPLTEKDARGLCGMHYRRWRLYGDPDIVQIIRFSGTPEERFWKRVDKSGDCWLWTGALNPCGYGIVGHGTAHRFSWLLTGQAIPEGTELDHLCHSRDLNCNDGNRCVHRRCVNPDHLEPVSHHENVMRGVVPLPENRRRVS